MSQVARETDTCTHGLAFLAGSDVIDSVKVNGLSISVYEGSMVGTTGPCGKYSKKHHPEGKTIMGVAAGSSNVFAAGIRVHSVGQFRGCGAITTTGSQDVFVN